MYGRICCEECGELHPYWEIDQETHLCKECFTSEGNSESEFVPMEEPI